MRLQHELESANPGPYSPGGIILPRNGYDLDQLTIHIPADEPILSAEDVRRMWDTRVPEWFTRALSQPLPGLQGEEVIPGFAVPMSTWYDNPTPENRKYRLNVALDRDDRLNNEERDEYNRTLAELEFGQGFFRRAHP